MTVSVSRGVLLMALLAVSMHAILFLLIRPVESMASGKAFTPPETGYGNVLFDSVIDGSVVRTVHSPVLFSLPSPMGFSSALSASDVKTHLNTFSRPEQAERFLEVEPVGDRTAVGPAPGELLVYRRKDPGPGVPESAVENGTRRAPRRIFVSSSLKERLEGGVVFPQELNQVPERAWEATARVAVAKSGQVEHVFLEKPVEPASLNQHVLHLLYSLQFRPGGAVEGTIEIYSPLPEGASEEGS